MLAPPSVAPLVVLIACVIECTLFFYTIIAFFYTCIACVIVLALFFSNLSRKYCCAAIVATNCVNFECVHFDPAINCSQC